MLLGRSFSAQSDCIGRCDPLLSISQVDSLLLSGADLGKSRSAPSFGGDAKALATVSSRDGLTAATPLPASPVYTLDWAHFSEVWLTDRALLCYFPTMRQNPGRSRSGL